MPTMNVSLSSELAAFVEDEIASGEYGTASEVVRDGLRLLHRDKAVRDDKLAVLRREIHQGMEDVRAGRFSDQSIEEIAASLRKSVKKS